MGQYKVPQNVEAEDKIIGPLTFKQFVYALIGIFYGLIIFGIFHTIIPLMIVIGVPPTLLFLLLAFYTRDGQNFEQLLIAMVSFFANARRRRWIKEDVIEALHITPKPKEIEQTQVNPQEIRSQLDKIASMVDSRGWQSHAIVQDPNIEIINPTVITPSGPLIGTEPTAGEDILDFQHSPLAQNLSELINSAASDVREEAIQQMKSSPVTGATPAVTAPSSSGIVELATQRDDLTVSQLAATATRMVPLPAGEVVEVRGNGRASN